MCFSSSSSLTAWITSTVIAMYLWQRNRRFDRWNAGFILSFSFIQLWEAGIWSSTNRETTELFMKLIVITLLTQPLAQTWGAMAATGPSRVLTVMLYVYIAILLYTIYRVSTNRFSTSIGPNGHLVWEASDGGIMGGWLIGILYLFGLFLGLLYGLPTTILLIAVGILTIIVSLGRAGTGEFGSYWCYTAVAYSVAALFS